MRIRSYRDLIVWQKAIALNVAVNELIQELPPADRFVFEVQARKAARSIAANISEGHQRHDLGDYLRHVSFAMGSAAELETDLEIIRRTSKTPLHSLDRCDQLVTEVGKMLTSLKAKLWAFRRSTKGKLLPG